MIFRGWFDSSVAAGKPAISQRALPESLFLVEAKETLRMASKFSRAPSDNAPGPYIWTRHRFGSLSQRTFDKRYHKISELPSPNWTDKNQSPPPATAHTTLGKVQNYGPYPDRIDMPPIPL